MGPSHFLSGRHFWAPPAAGPDLIQVSGDFGPKFVRNLNQARLPLSRVLANCCQHVFRGPIQHVFHGARIPMFASYLRTRKRCGLAKPRAPLAQRPNPIGEVTWMRTGLVSTRHTRSAREESSSPSFAHPPLPLHVHPGGCECGTSHHQRTPEVSPCPATHP